MSKKKKVVYRRSFQEQLLPEQDFFMKLDDPVAFRRTVLETSKATLSTLKGIYAVKEIRQRKLAKLAELQREIREIRLLIQKAEELMPKYTKQQAVKRFTYLVPKKEQPKKEVPKLVVPKQEEKKPEPKPVIRTKTELERLSDSINAVEKRMNKLPETKLKTGKENKAQQIAVAKQVSPERKSTPNEDLGIELGKALDKIHKRLKEI